MNEIWRPIRAYEGAFEVSDMGRVRSLSRILSDGRRWAGRVRRLKRLDSGHQSIKLVSRGPFLLVHRLVLEAFIGPCPEGMEGCHNNGHADDNRLTNLRWDTRLANNADKIRHGRSLRGAQNNRAKLCGGDVERMRDLARCGVTGRRIAALFMVTPANVSSILKGKTWNHAS